MLKHTRIISGFPGIGKSFFRTKYQDYLVYDAETTSYLWKMSDSGKQKNQDFPNNFIKHLKSLIGIYDFIFIRYDKDIQDALITANIPYGIIYPNKSLKSEFIRRYNARKASQLTIDLLNDNFEKWIDEIQSDKYSHILKHKLVTEDEYITPELLLELPSIDEKFYDDEYVIMNGRVDASNNIKLSDNMFNKSMKKENEIRFSITIKMPEIFYEIDTCLYIKEEEFPTQDKDKKIEVSYHNIISKAEAIVAKEFYTAAQRFDNIYNIQKSINLLEEQFDPNELIDLSKLLLSSIDFIKSLHPDKYFIDNSIEEQHAFINSLMSYREYLKTIKK